MRDVIRDAMTRPDCILGVVPDGGGMWLSPLRPDTPRNFAEKPEEWNDAMTAANQIGSDDWSFQIKMNVLSQIQQTSGEIFNNESGSPLKIYGDLIASGSAAFYLRNYVELETWTGKHELQLDVVSGNATLYVDGTLVATKPTGLSTLNFTRASKTSADIEIEFVEFRNLTTGETVWQASRDELYETNPWPSSIPENFAVNAYDFYDCQAVVQEAIDPTHDYRFLIDFKLDEEKTIGNVFYSNPSDAPFALVLQSNNQIDFFTNLLKPNGDSNPFASLYVYYQSDVKLQGRHQIECKIAANTLSSYLDGVLVAQKASNLVRTGLAAVGLPSCNSGYVYKIQITDLTDNQVVWSYPSEAERVQLLTKTNVRTDRGVFEAAETSKSWSVTTQLRAASLLPECTIIVEADNPNGVAVTFVSCAQRENPTQGFFVIRGIDSTSVMFGYSGKNNSGITSYPTRFITCPEGEHIFAFVLDYSALQLRIYIDGAEVDNRAMDTGVVAPPEFDGTEKPVILGVTSTSEGLNLTSKISYCLIFDRALTAAEIAAFGNVEQEGEHQILCEPFSSFCIENK